MEARTASLLITILSTVIALSSSFRSSEATGVALYWGQRPKEVPLKAVCDTGFFAYINLAFLIISDDGKPPALNLTGHCGPAAGNCSHLRKDVRHCQDQGIKVLLSIQISSDHVSSSPGKDVADHIVQNYLSGNTSGPLGAVFLDGVDFHVESPAANPSYWNDVAKALSNYSDDFRKIYLAAAPLCPYPDGTLNTTIQTGIIDYVWVQFYNNRTCDCNGNHVDHLLRAWNNWSMALPERSQLFMGLPTNPCAVQSGYIDPQILALDVLPKIRPYKNYGGLMLWNVSFLDPKIHPYVEVAGPELQAPHIKMIAES